MQTLPYCSSCVYCIRDTEEKKRARFICTNEQSEHFDQIVKLAQSCPRFSEEYEEDEAEKTLCLIIGDENGETVIYNT